MGWVMGFEPTNTGTTIRCLRPLGDTHHIKLLTILTGTPGGTRLHLRKAQMIVSLGLALGSNSPTTF